MEQARIRVLLEQFLRPGRDRCQIVDGEGAALGLDTDLVRQTVVKCEAHQHDARLHRKPDRCEGAFDTLCDDDSEVPLEAPHELIDRIVHATPCAQTGDPASGGHSSTVVAMNRTDAAARATPAEPPAAVEHGTRRRRARFIAALTTQSRARMGSHPARPAPPGVALLPPRQTPALRAARRLRRLAQRDDAVAVLRRASAAGCGPQRWRRSSHPTSAITPRPGLPTSTARGPPCLSSSATNSPRTTSCAGAGGDGAHRR